MATTVAELGEPAVVVDGRQVEPTPSGFLAALGDALGRPGATRSAVDAGAALRSSDVGVLVVDGFERFDLPPVLEGAHREGDGVA